MQTKEYLMLFLNVWQILPEKLRINETIVTMTFEFGFECVNLSIYKN